MSEPNARSSSDSSLRRRPLGALGQSLVVFAHPSVLPRRFNDEVWDGGDEAALDELFAEDVVDHGAIPGQSPGREGHNYQLNLFRSAFPNLHVTSEDIFSEGDKVAYRWTRRGTHQGELLGIAPTGGEVTFKGIDVLRIAEGKVVERWSEYNALEAMQQMGVLLPPEEE
jgi:predicted ester cyclase